MDRLVRSGIEKAIDEAAAELGADLKQDGRGLPGEFSLSGPSPASAPRDGTIVFLRSADPAGLERLAGLRGCLLILPLECDPEVVADAAARGNAVLRAKNPKYAYAAIASSLYPLTSWRGEMTRPIGPSAWAAPDAVIEDGVVVEPFVTVGRLSRVGAGTILMRGASIGPAVEIGPSCVIREGAVIGDLGFGFAFDGDRPPRRIPQIGGVRLGSGVEVGALSSVSSGTMEPTTVEDDVKINNHVHIAHNARIGKACVIGCGVTVSGSVAIGAGAWLAPGARIRNKASVGAGAVVGMGAVVVADVAPGVTVAGVPAKPMASASDPRA
jgi:UDP-3-O-[3-hydroxymyristoyl] glucosamine N-acyltransferase LpxD